MRSSLTLLRYTTLCVSVVGTGMDSNKISPFLIHYYSFVGIHHILNVLAEINYAEIPGQDRNSLFKVNDCRKVVTKIK